MMGVRRRLTCCTKDREISIDFDEKEIQHERIMTYDGLESCILNSDSYRNESGTSKEYGFTTDSVEEDDASCSSSKDAFGSFVPQWIMKKDNQETDEWDIPASPQQFYVREKPTYVLQFSDLDAMKETFAKLLLGADVTGGCKGVTTALALSNGITNLAASVFGELWKLEPLPEEKKAMWRKEMDWFLSPANHMVELVPAKQSGTNGCSFEIMTPKARTDVHMNLPALQKLDSMLIEILDSMVKTEFWYSEGSSRSDGRDGSERQSRRWWLPCPRVPAGGLSENARKKILGQANVVHQVFKAAKSINEDVLHEMLVPGIIKDALPKSARASLGEQLYKVLCKGSRSSVEMVNSLKLKSEHEALNTVNKLEAAALAWRSRIKEQARSKSPGRTSWPFRKDPISEMDKVESFLFRVEALLQQLKMKFPFLPHTFLDATKVQYGKDVGHSILEAYSRVIANSAHKMLSRIGDILQEDQLSNPSSRVAKCGFLDLSQRGMPESPAINSGAGKMNKVDGYASDSNASRTESEIFSPIETKTSSATDTPGQSSIWCNGGSPSVSH